MKKIIASISALFVAGTATSGSLTDPIVESAVEEAPRGSGALIPLLLIAGVAAVIALDNGTS